MRGILAFCCLLAISDAAALADKEGAKASARRAMQHYNLAEYEEALKAFKDAYRQFEEPALLFNIGQCHRQLGHKQEAITFFRTYLREVPDAPNREDVKRLNATLEQEWAAERASRVTPPQGMIAPPEVTSKPSTPPVIVATAPPSPTPPRRKLWIWGVVAGAVAVVAISVGLGVGLSASERDPVPSLGSVTKN
jgi:tetratricopeptide (TPR) repeat protein